MWWLNSRCATTLSTTLLASSSNTNTTPNDLNDAATIPLSAMKVTSLARYAVKGLSPDMLHSVHIATDGEGTFPDDRRFALLKSKNDDTDDDDDEDDDGDGAAVTFDVDKPEWIHKQNFLCAFTAPKLMATLDCEYKIVRMAAAGDTTISSGGGGGIGTTSSSTTAAFSFGLPNDGAEESARSDASTATSGGGGGDDDTAVDRRLLTIWKRQPPSSPQPKPSKQRTSPPLLGPVDLSSSYGRDELATFFSKLSPTKQRVVCVSKRDDDDKGHHTHQFGNTRAGVRNNDGDTRTVHIVNAATVRQVSEKIGVNLDPMRFRPNIVVDGLEPWKEFDLVGRTLRVVAVAVEDRKELVGDDGGGDGGDNEDNGGIMELDVLSTTVRCAGIGIDPLDPGIGTLDMPILLAKHFPQYGPYFGVYATVRTRGTLRLGDELELMAGSLSDDR